MGNLWGDYLRRLNSVSNAHTIGDVRQFCTHNVECSWGKPQVGGDKNQ